METPRMTSKVMMFDRGTGIEDPGRVSDAGTQRPDPEVPERARRRTFTAKYKLEILAAYDAAPDGEKGAVLRREGLYSSHMWSGAGPATPVRWRDCGAARASAARPPGRADRPAGGREDSSWSRSWQRPASWWRSRENCTRSWRRSPRARSRSPGRVEDVSDAAVAELAPTIGVRAACDAVGVAQAGYYRRHRQSPAPPRPAPVPHRDRPQPRALSAEEQQAILDELHSERFVDLSPAEVWAILLDEGRYLGSISTFYRLLRRAGEVRERGRQATHPATVKPELVATAPNQV